MAILSKQDPTPRSPKAEPRWAPNGRRFSLRRARKIRLMIQVAIIFVLLLIVLPLWLIYKPPRSVINYFAARFPDVLFHLPTQQKIVALTIDDTPSRYTPELLSLLVENNASATFFVIGGQVNTPDDQAVLAEIVRQGSELGNHAMHDEPSVRLPSSQLTTELKQVDAIIEQAYRTAGRERSRYLFRPGSGFFSRRILDLAASQGYFTILGDIFPHDPIVSVWWINAWHILSSLRPGGIIIVHDRRSWTVPMLAKVLPAITRKEYKAVSISEAVVLSNG